MGMNETKRPDAPRKGARAASLPTRTNLFARLTLPGFVRAPSSVLIDMIAPGLLASVVFCSGLLLLASAATPSFAERLHWLAKLVPLFVVEFSHFVASLIGTALLLLAAGLANRLKGAWRVTLGLLVCAAVFAFLKGGDIEEAVIFTTITLLALPLGPAFYRTDRLTQIRFSPKYLMVVVLSLTAITWLGFFAYRDIAYRNELWWTFVTHGDASRFLRGTVGVAALVLIVILRQVMARAPKPPAVGGAKDMASAANILTSAEDATPESNLALLGDKRFLFAPSGQGFVQFGVRGNLWVAMGGPVGPLSDFGRQVRAFQEAADAQGAKCAFYAIAREHVADFVDTGFAVQKIGETALVDLPAFGLEGSKRAEMRHVRNRGAREGLSISVYPRGGFDTIEAELAGVSESWLATHTGQEKSFSLGRFEANYLQQFPIAVVRKDSAVVAFANLWPTASKSKLTIDLMRYASDAPNGTMDFLFVELLLWAKAEGYRVFDLGMAPLAGLENHRLARLVSRIGALVFAHAGHFYGFEGLRTYKNKFAPRWAPVYIAAPTHAEIPGALAAAALLTSGGMSGLFA